jgi:putative endonuclease
VLWFEIGASPPASLRAKRSNPEKQCKRHRKMRSRKHGYMYIFFNKRNDTLYTGVTSNLMKRVYEHKSNIVEGFTSQYGIDKLGYYEIHDTVFSAIDREKQTKGSSRRKKLALIEGVNPEWKDLYDTIV